MIGQTIGSYLISAKIGEGGMGAVFRGEHTRLGRGAAIKVLLPEFSNNKEVVQRFFNEAKATTAIKHPGIVEIYDFGHHTDGSAYIVMELLQGEPLSYLLHREKKLNFEVAVAIISQVAAALGSAHSMGIIHRDLKPDNVFLLPDPLLPHGTRVKLLDFGIAKLSEDMRGELEATRAGAVLGTPPYMAPEQCVGSTEVDHTADLYALGCLLFHCLCGRPPFISVEFARIMIEHLNSKPPSLRELEPSVPEALEQITLRLLEKTPKDRFQSCGQLVAALEGKPERAATPVPVAGAASAPMSAPLAPTLKDNAAAEADARAQGVAPTLKDNAVKAPSRKKTALMGQPIPPLEAPVPPVAEVEAEPEIEAANSRKPTALMGEPLPEALAQLIATASAKAASGSSSLPAGRKKTAMYGEHGPAPQPTPAPMQPMQPTQPTPAPMQPTPAPGQPMQPTPAPGQAMQPTPAPGRRPTPQLTPAPGQQPVPGQPAPGQQPMPGQQPVPRPAWLIPAIVGAVVVIAGVAAMLAFS